MKIFVGDSSGKSTLVTLKKHKIGRMLLRPRKLYEGEEWAFDNGAYGYWKNGMPFDENKFLKWFDVAYTYPPPYLAVLPDIVGGGDKSLDYSLSWLERLPADWPWYLAVQDGMTVGKVVEVISKVSGIFLGGTNEYKKYAGYWCKLSHHFDKRFHYARAGTLNKLAHAMAVGVDSIDSAFPLWTKDRLFAFIQALSQQRFDNLTIFAPHPEQGPGSIVQVRP